MGIPKFYRWLSDRYPLISQRLDEVHEFDNFYLDMNGIIHQCTHPNDDEVVFNDTEVMFKAIFTYTDRLYRIVRPSKLLFLAVDGVAPRAKMNQQRSRRFRSAKDNVRALAEAIAKGKDIPKDKPFDSNCITPGTAFMHSLSKKFKAWIHWKMLNDPAWQQGCNVIFSGAEVPGEGEHKIMDYIRNWRASDEWEPTRRHCMYGLDADLIMLGLVTHEPHFTLLRERIRWRGNRRRVPVMKGDMSDAEEFELLEISLLRDMLYLEFRPQSMRQPLRRSSGGSSNSSVAGGGGAMPQDGQLSFKYEAMRVVDDFVFMCMLVGNDFVPHIPHLDIAEGALNLMFRSYKELLPTWGGYLTDLYKLHPDRLESFFHVIAEAEERYFATRSIEEADPLYEPQVYRRHYYLRKLGIDVDDRDAMSNLILNYVEGLHWVLQYYHNGCPSWNWYFKYFYAPLASDMQSLRSYRVRLHRGRPFRPLTQLLAVLPPDSAQFLPKPFQELMVSDHSKVIDFYPTEFEVDYNGKKNAWEAVVLIPFIDEHRLLNEVRAIRASQITPDELQRNKLGRDRLFAASAYPHSTAHIAAVRPMARSDGRSRGRPNSKPQRTNRRAKVVKGRLDDRSGGSDGEGSRPQSSGRNKPPASPESASDGSSSGGGRRSRKTPSSSSSASTSSSSSTSTKRQEDGGGPNRFKS